MVLAMDDPNNRNPYGWQGLALSQFVREVITRKEKKNFFVAATPGAGKTRFAFECAKRLLSVGEIKRIVVVVPTIYLKEQWSKTGEDHFGLKLDYQRSNYDELETEELDGMVLTYGQAASPIGRDVQKGGCRKHRTLVIFDEVHHAGDKASWGEAILEAYSNASYRLLLSGTPFRPLNTNDRIPFLTYDEAGRSVPDYPYGYGRALAAGNNVLVVFPSHEGDMEWWADGKRHKAKFEEELSEKEARRRLRTAINPRGSFLKNHLSNAEKKLRSLREEHPNAAGLVIADNQHQAKKICEALKTISNEEAVLAIQDEPDAHKNIAGFSGTDPKADKYDELKNRKWLVAVQMVSEGVDIPRLRVVVYAAAKIAELFFYQVVGRIVRPIPALTKARVDQTGHMYIPADPTLLSYAEKIRDERDHVVVEEIIEKPEGGDGGGNGGPSDYTPLHAEGVEDHDMVVASHGRFRINERKAVQMVVQNHPSLMMIDEEKQLIIVREEFSNELERALESMGVVVNGGGTERFMDRKKKKSGEVETLARSLGNLRCRKEGFIPRTPEYDAVYEGQMKTIHGALADMSQGKRKAQRTLEDLERNVEWLEEQMRLEKDRD